MNANSPMATQRPRVAACTLFLAALTLGFANIASATIYYASPTGTGTGLTWATAGPLQTMLSGAKMGDQVWVLKGTYIGNYTTTDGLSVYGGFAGTETATSQRNIPANPSILNASGSGRVYSIPSDAVADNTLDGFTVEKGGFGGLSDQSEDSLSVANCTFTSNDGSGFGGAAVLCAGSSLTISSCSFTSNTLDSTMDITAAYGGAVLASTVTDCNISNSSFSDNSISGMAGTTTYGGAIGALGPLTLISCTFTGNSTSSAIGGSVYCSGSAPSIIKCTFTSNESGGLVSTSSSVSVSNCSFLSNSDRGLTMTGSGKATVTFCTFVNNSITGQNGGGMYTSCPTATIGGCTFTDNSTTGAGSTVYGGGLYCETGTNTAISGCAFNGNTAIPSNGSAAWGGGVASSGTPSISSCTFMQNSPGQIDIENVGSQTSPAYVTNNLIFGLSTSTAFDDGIEVSESGSGSGSAYAVIANNTIANAADGIAIGSGTGVTGAVTVANNIYYANGTAVEDNSGVSFASSHNDLYANSTGYSGHGITTSSSDLADNPIFVTNPNFSTNPVNYGNLMLASGSLLIGAGDTSYVTTGETDLNYNPREVNGKVDIGCYETQSATISSFTPASGGAGTMVTISGSNFTGASYVRFNGASTSFTVVSSTEITTIAPSKGSTGPITVTTPGGTATSATNFTYTLGPPISSFSPTSGLQGMTVTINGTGFTGATYVRFNGASTSFTVVSDTQITAIVPSRGSTGPISVTTPSGTGTSTTNFTYLVAPKITSLVFNPSTVAPGGKTTATITLDSPADTGGARITVTEGPFDFITVTIAAGQTTGMFGVGVSPSAAAGSYPFAATYLGSSASGTLMVN